MWNDVSKIPTAGLPGNTFWKARMARASGPLCRGANSANSSIFWIASSSNNVDSLKISPPATTRWPVPEISS